MMRNYGQREKYDHVYLAWNRRLDTIQAAVLRVKLARLDNWNAARRTIASLYDELLGDPNVVTPWLSLGAEHVYHQYVVQIAHRDEVLQRLNERGIGAGV